MNDAALLALGGAVSVCADGRSDGGSGLPGIAKATAGAAGSHGARPRAPPAFLAGTGAASLTPAAPFWEEKTVLLVYTFAWVPMVLIAIANGIARDRGYKRHVTELRAHQISTLIGAILFTIYAWALSLRWPLASAGQAFAIGAIWLALTVAFEFLFGHLVLKFTWRRLLMDYNLLKGRVWVLILVWLLVLPYVVLRFAS